MIHDIRECLKRCSRSVDKVAQNLEIKLCLEEKRKSFGEIDTLLDLFDENPDDFHAQVNRFPIYKTEAGYCFRLYWEANDKVLSEGGLAPCGCDEEIVNPNTEDETDRITCEEAYPLLSSNCYSCCSEALKAFEAFCELFQNKESYELVPVSKTKNGPYSFQIIDTSKVLAYHAQQYNCLQDAEDAIKITKSCVDNTGMHLLEHILLRPKTIDDCGHKDFSNSNILVDQEGKNCLLPICPDYSCPIGWQPDMDKDDPCAEDSNLTKIHYLPGTDPYSFWATVALPGWVKRFRTIESREMFEKLLYKEAPALVGLNILWLSPRDMCKFEAEYRRWLEWLQIVEESKYSSNEEKRNSLECICKSEEELPICGLSTCIKVLKSEPACESIRGEQGDCNCKNDERVNDDECCLPLETKGTIFWSCLEESDVPVISGPTAGVASFAVAKDNAVKKPAIIKKLPSKETKKSGRKRSKKS